MGTKVWLCTVSRASPQKSLCNGCRIHTLVLTHGPWAHLLPACDTLQARLLIRLETSRYCKALSSVKSCTVAAVCVLLSSSSSHIYTRVQCCAMTSSNCCTSQSMCLSAMLAALLLRAADRHNHCVCDCDCDCVQCSVPIFQHSQAFSELPEQQLPTFSCLSGSLHADRFASLLARQTTS